MPVSEAKLTIRITHRMQNQLTEIHERHRIPVAEVARYLIDTGLASYGLGRDFDGDALVVDVAEWHHDLQSVPTKTRTNAAA